MILREVTSEARGFMHNSRFDGLGIATAVLPYLRSHAVSSPDLAAFIQTGQVDADSLPDR